MKHVVWLLLAACCLAFGQVQPVASPRADEGHCTCCDCGGACGMPDCAPPPVARTPVFAQAEARTIRAEATRRQAPARPLLVIDQPSRLAASVVQPTHAGVRGLPVAAAPAFLVHCSLLI